LQLFFGRHRELVALCWKGCPRRQQRALTLDRW
jgi:hypothetical protein